MSLTLEVIQTEAGAENWGYTIRIFSVGGIQPVIAKFFHNLYINEWHRNHVYRSIHFCIAAWRGLAGIAQEQSLLNHSFLYSGTVPLPVQIVRKFCKYSGGWWARNAHAQYPVLSLLIIGCQIRLLNVPPLSAA